MSRRRIVGLSAPRPIFRDEMRVEIDAREHGAFHRVELAELQKEVVDMIDVVSVRKVVVVAALPAPEV